MPVITGTASTLAEGQRHFPQSVTKLRVWQRSAAAQSESLGLTRQHALKCLAAPHSRLCSVAAALALPVAIATATQVALASCSGHMAASAPAMPQFNLKFLGVLAILNFNLKLKGFKFHRARGKKTGMHGKSESRSVLRLIRVAAAIRLLPMTRTWREARQLHMDWLDLVDFARKRGGASRDSERGGRGAATTFFFWGGAGV